MSDDLLSRAAGALRSSAEPSSEELRETRMRVMASLRRTRQRRVRVVTVVLPLAAVLATSLAWAGATGRLSKAVEAVREMFVAGTSEKQADLPPPLPSMSTTESPSAVPSEAPSEAPSAVASAVASAVPSTMPNAPSAGPSILAIAPLPKVVVEDAAVAVDARDADLEAYKKAHQLHFVAHDDAGALQAWDAYLAAFPNGTFAAEARYNRALCLLRLGRTLEARAALQPFADGKVAGGYRRQEAQALLDTLDAGP